VRTGTNERAASVRTCKRRTGNTVDLNENAAVVVNLGNRAIINAVSVVVSWCKEWW
jgi:ribosomal protein L14